MIDFARRPARQQAVKLNCFAARPARQQAVKLNLIEVWIRRLCYFLAQKGDPAADQQPVKSF